MTEETKSKRKRSPRGGAPAPGAKPRTAIRDRNDRAQIEHALATGQSVRAIAKKYDVDENALYRHRKNLPPQLRAAYIGNFLKPGEDLEKLRVTESESLLQNLAAQRARLLMVQDQELEAGNAQAVATATPWSAPWPRSRKLDAPSPPSCIPRKAAPLRASTFPPCRLRR